MKAPDKVYIDDLAVVNDCTTKISIKPLPNFSKYIRKDALLEWTESELESITGNFGLAEGGKIVLNMLIDKLNSM